MIVAGTASACCVAAAPGLWQAEVGEAGCCAGWCLQGLRTGEPANTEGAGQEGVTEEEVRGQGPLCDKYQSKNI